MFDLAIVGIFYVCIVNVSYSFSCKEKYMSLLKHVFADQEGMLNKCWQKEKLIIHSDSYTVVSYL